MKKLFIIFAVICLAAPAMAADWNFYGSERFKTFSVKQDDDTDAHDASQTNTLWDNAANARIGATVKFNDQIGGGFEVGNTINKRKLFGTYTFGNGSQLLLGQDYAPSTTFYSGSVFDADGALLGIGEFYEGRVPMIQLKMEGFKIALIKPTAVNPDATLYNTKTTFPEIEAAYDMKSDMFHARGFGAYQTYDLDGIASGTDDLTVNSYVIGGGGGVVLGALYINLGAHYGQNLGNMGAYAPTADGGSDIGLGQYLKNEMAIENQNEKDTTGWGFEGVIGFNASDMLTIEAGYGYEYGEEDLDNTDGSSLYQMYLNAAITVAPGFMIVPEVGYIEADPETYGASPDPNPSTTYFGAKWQIDF